jgi:SLT domain-containing protein/murein DD-endopeptidase MepM/ murein hydrolase activator NlpD
MDALKPLVPVLVDLAEDTMGVFTTSVEGAAGVLEAIVGVVKPAVEAFNGLPDPVKKTTIAVGAFIALQKMFPNFTTSFGQMGSGVLGHLKGMGDKIAAVPGAFANWKGAVSGATGSLGDFRAATSLTVGAIGKGAAKGLMGAASGLVSFLGGPWGIALGAAGIALTMWAQKQQEAKQRTEEFKGTLDETTGKLTDATWGQITENLSKVNSGFAAWWAKTDGKSAIDFANELGVSMDDMKGYILGTKDGVKALTKDMNASKASSKGNLVAYQELIKTLDEQKGSLSKAQKEQLAKIEADKALVASNDEAARSIDRMNTAIKTAADSTQDMTSRTKALKDALDELNGETKSTEEASRDLDASTRTMVQWLNAGEKQTKGFAQAIKISKDGVIEHSEAGDQLNAYLQDYQDKSRAAALAAYDKAGGDDNAAVAAKAAAAAYRKQTKDLRKNLEGTKLSKGQIDALIGSMDGVPDDIRFTLSSGGTITKADKAIRELQKSIRKTPNAKKIIIHDNSKETKDALKALGLKVKELPDGTISVSPNKGSFADVKKLVDNAVRDREISVSMRMIGNTKDFADNAVSNATNIFKKAMKGKRAAGGIDMHGMASGGVTGASMSVAQMVKPGDIRFAGDRSDVDEAWIPLDGSKRSWKILTEALRRMPGGAEGMAKGGVTSPGMDTSGLKDAGKQTATGFVTGLESQQDAIRDAIANITGLVIYTANDELGIHSPSRVFKTIGSFLGKGFVKGIDGTRDQAKEATSKLIEQTREAFDKRNDLVKKANEKIIKLQKQLNDAPTDGAGASRVLKAEQRVADARARLAEKVAAASKKDAPDSAKDAVATAKRALTNAQTALKEARAAAKASDVKAAARRKNLRTQLALAKAEKSAAQGLTKGGETALVKRLKGEQSQLTRLAGQRDRVAEKLKDAQQALDDVLKERKDYEAGIVNSLASPADVTKLGTSADEIIGNLGRIKKSVTGFNTTVKKLRDAGLNKSAIDQIVQSGPEGGSATAKAILAGGDDAIKRINDLQKGVTSSAKATAKTSGEVMYQVGIDAAQGIVKGLKSQEKALSKQMVHLGNQMASAVKKALKIHSPSRLFADEVGAMIPAGIGVGVDAGAKALNAKVAGLVQVPGVPDAASPAGGSATSAGTSLPTIGQAQAPDTSVMTGSWSEAMLAMMLSTETAFQQIQADTTTGTTAATTATQASETAQTTATATGTQARTGATKASEAAQSAATTTGQASQTATTKAGNAARTQSTKTAAGQQAAATKSAMTAMDQQVSTSLSHMRSTTSVMWHTMSSTAAKSSAAMRSNTHGQFTALARELEATRSGPMASTFSALSNTMRHQMPAAFRAGKESSAAAFAGLGPAAKSPVEYIINTVYNSGIRGVWNKVASEFDKKHTLPEYRPKGFYTGGYTGDGGKYQKAGDVHAGEYVFRQEATTKLRKTYGLKGLDHINRTGELPGYANGGLVKPLHGWQTDFHNFGEARAGGRHLGDDLAVGMRSPVYATADGKVAKTGWNIVTGRTGIGVFLNHAGNHHSYYGHLTKALVEAGQRVKAGQRIALSGSTGNSSGPHLHFEWWNGGNYWKSPVNPASILAGGSMPKGGNTGVGGDLGVGFIDPEVYTKPLDALKKKLGGAGSGQWASMAQGVGSKMIDTMTSWITDNVDSAGVSVAGPDGSGVSRWRGQVKKALKANGLPTSAAYVNAWLRQINTESGGNPKAVQGISDINSAMGLGAKGLLQTISPTFAAFAFPGHQDIFNGYDNMLAAMRYAKNRYGKNMLATIGHGHGYANGTSNAAPGYHWVGEQGPELLRFKGGETVRNNNRSRTIAASSKLTREDARMIASELAAVQSSSGFTINGPVTTQDPDELFRQYDKITRRREKLAVI